MPRARPDTVANPASQSPRVIRSVIFTLAAEALREPTIATGGIARHSGIAADRNQGRRVVDHLQPARIVRLAERDQRNPRFAASLDLTFSLFAGANLRRAGAAAACQCRQRFKRRACSAEMVEQRTKGARADILTADESQPVQPLFIRQTY